MIVELVPTHGDGAPYFQSPGGNIIKQARGDAPQEYKCCL